MISVEDLLGCLQRPKSQPAPSWRVRITFADGTEWEDIYDPAERWPTPLATNPPAHFIARQSMALARFYLREHRMMAVRVAVDPPPGTTDNYGQEVKSMVLACFRPR
jgi:hypothetical protein